MHLAKTWGMLIILIASVIAKSDPNQPFKTVIEYLKYLQKQRYPLHYRSLYFDKACPLGQVFIHGKCHLKINASFQTIDLLSLIQAIQRKHEKYKSSTMDTKVTKPDLATTTQITEATAILSQETTSEDVLKNVTTTDTPEIQPTTNPMENSDESEEIELQTVEYSVELAHWGKKQHFIKKLPRI